jgi:hypothetical protein
VFCETEQCGFTNKIQKMVNDYTIGIQQRYKHIAVFPCVFSCNYCIHGKELDMERVDSSAWPQLLHQCMVTECCIIFATLDLPCFLFLLAGYFLVKAD